MPKATRKKTADGQLKNPKRFSDWDENNVTWVMRVEEEPPPSPREEEKEEE